VEQVALDLEVYQNYFLAMFKRASGGTKHFEMYEGKEFDVASVKAILNNFEIVTFNGNGFDIPVLTLALNGASCETLKFAADEIIKNDLKHWQFEKRFNVRYPNINHIDLIEVAPGQGSLKIYGGRMHTPEMEDLPIEPDALIAPEDRPQLIKYCGKDLLNTMLLADKLKPQIELRRQMSKEYGIDLRSKSDAQIAEAVIKSEVTKILGRRIQKAHGQTNRYFKYDAPTFLKYRTEQLENVLKIVTEGDFFVDGKGSIQPPKAFEETMVTIGNSVYSMGIGGLHSTEKEAAHKSSDKYILKDWDVASYYPAIIINNGLYPENMGEAFPVVFKNIVDRRLAAKHSGDKVVADSLKITINGTFGKLGSMHSILYAPKLMIQTTVTGQLSLLMLIEALESLGISVVSANTDGIVIKCPREKETHMNAVIAAWQKRTGFDMEDTEYKAIYSRDVNNYIAIKTDGKVKTKGAYADAGLQKNPQNEVCIKAVVEYLKNGTLVEETVRGCTDVRLFVTVRSVTGGAIKDRKYLGKAIRWYYAKGETGTIVYKKENKSGGNNVVPRTYGAKPLMDLPESVPEDVDYDWYIRECNEILMDIGAVERPPVVPIPRKNSKDWKGLLAEGKIELDPTDPKGSKYRWVA
jgi:DNA polymerase elongation subunit (family B)